QALEPPFLGEEGPDLRLPPGEVRFETVEGAQRPARRLSAASFTASTMCWYPVQRQRLPERAWRISASVGSGFSSRNGTRVIRKPGVQKPHGRPWHSQKACCRGWSSPDEGASPSTVLRAWPSACTASRMQ